ncbi:MAG: sensor histidine kinase [Candidatus Dormibacteria bacterium]
MVVLFVVMGLATSDAVTYSALRGFLLNRVDSQLVALHSSVERSVLSGRGFGGPNSRTFLGTVGAYFEVRDADGAVIYPGPGGPPDEQPQFRPKLPTHLPPCCNGPQPVAFNVESVPAGGPRYRVLGDQLANGSLAVAISLADVDNTLANLLQIELLVSLLVLGGALWGGLVLVRLGLRPLEKMAGAAGEIAGGDLSRRVHPADAGSEVGRLGLALNSMLGQIETAFAERTASEDRLRRLVADASHELRTPLTSIRGYAELFRRGARSHPDDLERSMRRIEEEAARMGVLVDDLLLLARLDSGRALEQAEVELSLVLSDAVDAARAVEPGRPLEAQLESGLKVRGDGGRLRQVFDNLLANVRIHTPSETPASVRLWGSDGQVIVEVADSGPGMPEQQADHAFERFYRADGSRSRDSGGAGLGLAIVSAIVTAHGGRVSLRTAPGEGAAFTVSLPALA